MNAWALTAIAAALALLLIAHRRIDVLGAGDEPVAIAGADAADVEDVEQGQGGGFIDWTLAALDPSTYVPTMNNESTSAANQAAFLLTIRHAEGTAGQDGYRTMFGHRLFYSWTDHPRQAVQFTDKAGRKLWTSAAGAYQFMALSPLPGGKSTAVNTWDRMAAKLGLPDFSPESQDRAALGLIDDAGALNDVHAGRFDVAIYKVRRIWASLPGAGYSQGERSLPVLRGAYEGAGGSFA